MSNIDATNTVTTSAPVSAEQTNAGSVRSQLAAQIAPGSPARTAVANNTTLKTTNSAIMWAKAITRLRGLNVSDSRAMVC